jgi:hypothetical protein
MHWYKDWNHLSDDRCRVARCYATECIDDERAIVLEDLDASGFPIRHSELDLDGVKTCLRWLANFHGCFMGAEPTGLWSTGTYWHLQTRPDESAAMEEGEIKQSAKAIDKMLSECQYQTLVHGDAKVANFCFSPDGQQIAAVDFQYVGGGCGMKDVAYFMGSCLDSEQCECWQDEILDYYFDRLKEAVTYYKKQVKWRELESEWRTMFPIAWTDFYRFMLGWAPDHKKINEYTRRLAEYALSLVK